MKVLVTGATGLLGGYLVRTLLDAGHDVRVLVRPSSQLDGLSGLPVEIVNGDILVPDDRLSDACAGCEMVFHAAAYFSYSGRSGSELSNTALDGTRNVLQACERANVRRVTVTSSSVVFGHCESPDRERDESSAIEQDDEVPYVAAKVEQHLAALSAAREMKTEVVLACPTIILGESGAPLGPSNGLVVSYLRDPFHCTFPGGCNIVRAADVADGHLIVATRGKPGESYLLGSSNFTWREIHSQISMLAGLPGPRLELNHTLAYLAASIDEVQSSLANRTPLSSRTQAQMIGRYYWYSSAKAQALGYSPGSGNLALLEAVSWLAASKYIDRETRTRLSLSKQVFEFRRNQHRAVGAVPETRVVPEQ